MMEHDQHCHNFSICFKRQCHSCSFICVNETNLEIRNCRTLTVIPGHKVNFEHTEVLSTWLFITMHACTERLKIYTSTKTI